mgnify:CR=1 FL=1
MPGSEAPIYDVMDCDVIVVGSGAAGLSAALAAAVDGARVVVLEKAGVLLDPETGKLQVKTGEAGAPVLNEEERKRLGAFADFIDSLDLDDFEKRQSAGS